MFSACSASSRGDPLGSGALVLARPSGVSPMFRSRVQGSPAGLPEADAGMETNENSGSEQGWPLPYPSHHEAPPASNGGPAAARTELCPAEMDAPGVVRWVIVMWYNVT